MNITSSHFLSFWDPAPHSPYCSISCLFFFFFFLPPTLVSSLTQMVPQFADRSGAFTREWPVAIDVASPMFSARCTGAFPWGGGKWGAGVRL